MGQEISDAHFRQRDFKRFQAALEQETDTLRGWFREQRFSDGHPVAGFELETWLVDQDGLPAPANEAFLEGLADPLVVPELARFNVELNSTPHVLKGNALSSLERELAATLARCNEVAEPMGLELLPIGILPSAEHRHFCLANMSAMQRYRALNEQVLRMRGGRALELDITGRERLNTRHDDVMVEAAATSLQIHLQVPPDQAVRYFNAAQVVSGPMVAISCNAPYLFGRDLWAETRIPLFEQAVAISAGGGPERVSMGSGYLRHSLLECFEENLAAFPVLLPHMSEESAEGLPNLRFHNGTIWRWNRPLIGLPEQGGGPHLRIEHRVVSAGPSPADIATNMALFFGLVQALVHDPTPPEARLPFEHARANLYAAAEHGLQARVEWLDGQSLDAVSLWHELLLPLAFEGLAALGLDEDDRQRYLGIAEGRLTTRQTGSAWQRAWVARHGRDMKGLVAAYREGLKSGMPVHEWGN